MQFWICIWTCYSWNGLSIIFINIFYQLTVVVTINYNNNKWAANMWVWILQTFQLFWCSSVSTLNISLTIKIGVIYITQWLSYYVAIAQLVKHCTYVMHAYYMVVVSMQVCTWYHSPAEDTVRSYSQHDIVGFNIIMTVSTMMAGFCCTLHTWINHWGIFYGSESPFLWSTHGIEVILV